mgnify:CR=1 FL=1
METIYQTIVRNILAFRKEADLSQLALATSAEIALKTLHAIEHANANARLNTLEKIADALRVPMARLFEGNQHSSSALHLLIELLSQNQ